MRVLLVDHDSEGLEAIARAIRGVLELDCVTSKGDALLLLRQNTYDVLIACERAIDGSGLDLLGRTTRTAVPLKRIFAAAPERLQLLGPRLAPFKVQRTINYPIDLEELWLAIAQVTGGPDDETDGTIERVVLDERGIPSTGTVPRGPIPQRPPAPLAAVPSPPPAPPMSAAPVPMTSASGRYATARVAQPVPEPPLRAPAARAAAPTPMRAPAPPMQAMPPMPMNAPAPQLPAWTPEPPTEDDFAAVAAQARLGVQQKVVDEASRRKRQRLFTACGIAIVVAGAIVFLIEKFYDPAARAREQFIAAEMTRMSEQLKVTDNLTMIEVDIEQAIMNNDFDTARRELATLIEKAPDHPRREFLQASIDRAVEFAKLSPPGVDKKTAPAQAAVLPAGGEQRPASRPLPAERTPDRTPDRVVSRAPDRTTAQRPQRDASPPLTRSYGAPIGDVPRESLPLNAPINAPPTTTMRRNDNSFSGRTIEASDNSATRAPAPTTNATNAAITPAPAAAGSAAVNLPPAAPPAATPPAPVDIVMAKIVKRVTPEVPSGISRKTKGYVLVKYTISESGRVNDVEVLESTPQGTFDEAALDAVRKWVYEPRKENGVAVASQGKARLVFDAAN
ncbi:MAG TPA: TonB family protein [Steroidobacteraceae bacterium]|nr:TonB family protein [Steroidobacteraceae bacterium]